jgi:hypothetical protein
MLVENSLCMTSQCKHPAIAIDSLVGITDCTYLHWTAFITALWACANFVAVTWRIYVFPLGSYLMFQWQILPKSWIELVSLMSSMYASDESILEFSGLLFCAQENICWFQKTLFWPIRLVTILYFKCQTFISCVWSLLFQRWWNLFSRKNLLRFDLLAPGVEWQSNWL